MKLKVILIIIYSFGELEQLSANNSVIDLDLTGISLESPDSQQKIKEVREAANKCIRQDIYRYKMEEGYRIKAEEKKKQFEKKTGFKYTSNIPSKIEGRKKTDEAFKLWRKTDDAHDNYSWGKNRVVHKGWFELFEHYES